MIRPQHSRRTLLASVPGLCLAAPALAQTVQAGRAYVGFPPGGTADIITRLYVEQLRASLGRPLVVDNRAGAGGRLALEALKAAPADGSAFAVTPASMLTIYPHLYTRTLRYDVAADFTPVSPVCIFPFAFAVSARHPARTPQEFITWAKTRDAVDWASPVPGSMPHFIGTQLARLAGISMTHVPFRGSAPAIQGLLSGSIQAVLLPIGELTAFHRSGDLRLLAVTAPTRLERLPDVTTFAEAGLGGLTYEEWYGALLPARAPEPVVASLHAGIAAAMESASIRESLARLEMAPLLMEPSAFRSRMLRERDQWAPIVAASGFNPDE
ncbi:Bug family tripartite tricarboxylate transporter substrate binding protein [Sediminicoccus sp. BL-A-41-H5]|uniref:Bug family tripartite tricarboxylate transporter substrate binding protein n=1 Tax=Sediminicoccus sp. BL-A-41-H5 TaxID=3421106 RepID=UPI003D668F3B